jgi:phosphoserine phosphatase
MFVYVKDMDKAVDDYTSTHLDHIKQWYRDNKKEDDVVISASPEFLISAFCRKTGISCCMASRVNRKNGVYDGLNCHGEEKVRRFREIFGDRKIDRFYSDSFADTPLAKIADEAFMVNGDEVNKWPENRR